MTSHKCVLKCDAVDKGSFFSAGKLSYAQSFTQRRWRYLLPLALIFAGVLLHESLAYAQDINPADKNTEDATKADLLLFWEEKDLYVETATRVEKPLSQTAENVTVVTAKEIEDMNAHSVAEVLNRVPGVFVEFQGQDFVSPSFLKIQGSEPRHVTVLIDGVVWNFLADGNAETLSIPVRIIDRIEIIKGPASSVWGSALGGVINIITKDTGDTTVPRGVISASYGEADSQEYNGELFGKVGPVGYYLYAGKQKTGGLRDHRDYDRDNLYGKVSIAPSKNLDLLFTVGFSDSFISAGNNPKRVADSRTDLSNLYVTGALDYRFSPAFSLKGGIRYLRNRFDQPVNDMNSGELLRGTNVDEETVASDLRFTYKTTTHNAVVGVDISHGTIDSTTIYGPIFQAPPFNEPPWVLVSPTLNKWAIFANDTIDLGRFSVTPGIRFDHNNVSGSFLSPSIGATFEPAERVVLRASVARGFTQPPLGFTSTAGFFTIPNPGLTAEYGWSYQIGAETGISDYLNAKVILFRHDTTNALILDETVRTAKIYRNGGDVTRQGYELEAETAPLWNLSLKAGHAYVHKNSDAMPDWKTNYSFLVGIKYDDRRSFLAQLTGYYIWWDAPAANNAWYHTFIWDLNLNKKFITGGPITPEVFLTIRNLFNGAYYAADYRPNAGRWVEGGVRFSF